MRVVAIIQARMGSTRLPGKVLLDLAGAPMLSRCVNRTRRARTLDEVVVATTVQPADDAVAYLCAKCDWPCFRGSEDDVLDRYYRAAIVHKAEVVVRITADCPLIEPKIIDRVVQEFLARQPEVDYACNVRPRTFPKGLDVEVTHFDVLRQAWREDFSSEGHEHVTSYIWHNLDLFCPHNVISEVDYSYMRWTVDTLKDLIFVRQVYEHFSHDRFSWREVLDYVERGGYHPW